MCILFLHINPKPSTGKFRLILAANRDEVYKRPSKSADYWEEENTVIGGRDLEAGKEGGAWLALSARGRAAALLNVMSAGPHSPQLLGRGSLVAGFVKGQGRSATDYLGAVGPRAHLYRPFNFLAIELRPDTMSVFGYSNVGDTTKPISISTEYLGISNSSLDRPFVKVTAGVEQFRNIVQQYGTNSDKKSLHNQLLDFLKKENKHFPDEVMTSFAPDIPPHELQSYSSIYVKMPHKGYGTRAHTIITVDEDNQAEFSEWSMKEPIHPEQPQWESCHFSLPITFM